MIPSTIAGIAALVLGLALGTPWPALAGAGVTLLVGLFTRRLLQILVLLAFALVATAIVPTPGHTAVPLLGATAVALLAIVPLVLSLGARAPSPRGLLIPAVAGVVAFAFFLTPPGAVLLASDLATGAIIVALAAGLILASRIPSVSSWWSN